MLHLETALYDLRPEFSFKIATGDLADCHTVFVRLTDGDTGLVGFGEAVPVPLYGETRQGTLAFFKRVVADGVLHKLSPHQLQHFEQRLEAYEGHYAAKSALDMAMLDLHAKSLKTSLASLWGVDTSKPLCSAYTIAIDTLDNMVDCTRIALARGYRILKLKLGHSVEHDLALLKRLRQTVDENGLDAHTVPFWVDVNTGWTAAEFNQCLPVLVQTGVTLIEEPFTPETSLADRVAAKQHSPLPIILDESAHHAHQLPGLVEQCHGINIKLRKCGGLTKGRTILSTARALDLQVMLGGYLESSLAVTANAHLAPAADYLDLDSALLCGNDPAQGITWQGNRLFLPSNQRGIGATWHDSTSLEWVAC